MDRGQPLSLTVVERIAEHEGVSPEDLQPPLHYAVDTEALDALFRSSTAEEVSPTVEFPYQGYTVRVEGDGDVSILEPEPATRSEKEAA
ncbi:HalOD1 output domain-containing protein [Halosolutus amylolyticus]|uniref:HalOD1 output domain-containing protein n=1 Tax=Halosolutus amylolyticus TaxID=2932267 RepID=A0ABD5PM13_9EURY|nr:HalOD1 output domain-containing protein [Halosolutus amylolyticus]